MQPTKKLYPLVVTDAMATSREFYVGQLGCVAVFDMPHYLQLRFGDNEADPEVAFMAAPGAPPLGQHPAFSGGGVIISVPVADVDAHHRRMVAKGVAIATPPSDKPWGWRSYTVRDPSGVVLDFFHPLAEAPSTDASS